LEEHTGQKPPDGGFGSDLTGHQRAQVTEEEQAALHEN